MVETVAAVIAGGGFVATAAAATFAWVQAQATVKANETADLSLRAAEDAAVAAERQAALAADYVSVAQEAARTAERQAVAAEASVAVAKDAAESAERQATAAEASNALAATHREADRRAEAVLALSKTMMDSADLMIRAIDATQSSATTHTPAEGRLTQLDRFRINKSFIRGQALLLGDDVAVARWTLNESDRLFKESEALIDAGLLNSPKVGAARSTAMHVASETIATLFAWQRGEKPTEWFAEQIHALDA